METHNLGTSGLLVTKLGLGLAALGRPGYINLKHHEDLPEGYRVAEMERQTHQVLDAAYDAGIRYIDAARSYGRAESFLETWLQARKFKPGHVTIGSKWGYTYTADWQVEVAHHEIKDHSLNQLQRQWTESRNHLGQHLKLYQIHSATLETGVLEDTEVLNFLAHLKREKMRIGLSLSGAGQNKTLKKALDIEIDGVKLFDSVQATWNVLERGAEEQLMEAHKSGLGVILKEVLANGRLTARNGLPWDQRMIMKWQEMAETLGTTADALAIRVAMEQAWGDVVLSGATTTAQLASNLKAAEISLPAGFLEEVDEMAEDSDKYWARRKKLKWN